MAVGRFLLEPPTNDVCVRVWRSIDGTVELSWQVVIVELRGGIAFVYIVTFFFLCCFLLLFIPMSNCLCWFCWLLIDGIGQLYNGKVGVVEESENVGCR